MFVQNVGGADRLLRVVLGLAGFLVLGGTAGTILGVVGLIPLATCHNCRVVLDTTQQTIFLYRKQGRRAIPAARRQRLYNELQDTFLKRED